MDQDDWRNDPTGWNKPLSDLASRRYRDKHPINSDPLTRSGGPSSQIERINPSPPYTETSKAPAASSTFYPQELSSPFDCDAGFASDQYPSQNQLTDPSGVTFYPPSESPVQRDHLDQFRSYIAAQQPTGSQQLWPSFHPPPDARPFGGAETGPLPRSSQLPHSTASRLFSALDSAQCGVFQRSTSFQTPAAETTQIEQSKFNHPSVQRLYYIDSLRHFDEEGRSSYFQEQSKSGYPMIVAIDHSVVTMQDGTLWIKFSTRCLHPYSTNVRPWKHFIQDGRAGRDSQTQRDHCRRSEEGAEFALPPADEMSRMWSTAWQYATGQARMNDERPPATKTQVDVLDLATGAFESGLGFYLNPENIPENESAAMTIRRSKPVTFASLESPDLLDTRQLLMPISRFSKEQIKHMMSMPLDPDISVPSVIFGSKQLPSCR